MRPSHRASTTADCRRLPLRRAALRAMGMGLGVAWCFALPSAAQTGTAPTSGAAALPPVVLPGLAAPEVFSVSRVQFDGARSVPLPDLVALAQPFLNRPLRWLDVEELRQRVTRELVARGLVNSGAVLATLPLQDNTLHLQIIEGRVTELRATGLDGLSPEYLRQRLISPGQTLNLPRLQDRFAALLADPLIDRLNARLLPGAALGQSTLEVDVTRARPWQISFFANNQAAPSVGSSVIGAELKLHDLTGWGDQFAGTLSRSGGTEQHDLAWTVPLRARTTTLQARSARSRSSVVEEPLASQDIASRVDTHELTLTQPLLDGARQRLALGLTFGQRDSRSTLGGEPFEFIAGENPGRARLRAWRFFQDASWRGERGVLALRSTFVFGHHNGTVDGLVPDQPAPRYRLWLGQAQGSLPLGHTGTAGSLLLRGTLQHTSHTLVPLERLGLGGRYSVRGYRENQTVRDRGWAVSAEGQFPLLGDDGARRKLALVPFVDAGQARNVSGPTQRLASVGIGLRGQFDDVEADFFVARRLERRPVDTHGDLQDHGIHLSLRWRAF